MIYGKSIHIDLVGCDAYLYSEQNLRNFVTQIYKMTDEPEEGFAIRYFNKNILIQTNCLRLELNEEQVFVDMFLTRDFDSDAIMCYCRCYWEARDAIGTELYRGDWDD